MFVSDYVDVPRLLEVNKEEGYLAIEQVGRSLESLRQECHFSPLTVAQLAVQLLSTFENLHSTGYIHRDVKGDNMAISLNSDDPKIYLIDFETATRFHNSGLHIHYHEDASFTGNLVFCSVNMHEGIRASRRDDMESLAYFLVFLCSGSLPWLSIPKSAMNKEEEVLSLKQTTTSFQLCHGLELEFRHFVEYCRGLRFEEKPDYQRHRQMFLHLAQRLGFQGHWNYAWQPKSQTLHSSTKKRDRRKPTRLRSTLPLDFTGPSDSAQHTPLLSQKSCLVQSGEEKSGVHEEPPTPLVQFQLSIAAVRSKLSEAS